MLLNIPPENAQVAIISTVLKKKKIYIDSSFITAFKGKFCAEYRICSSLTTPEHFSENWKRSQIPVQGFKLIIHYNLPNVSGLCNIKSSKQPKPLYNSWHIWTLILTEVSRTTHDINICC